MKSVEFFLVTLPGLEDLVQAEVRDWFPDFETRADYGGVTVLAPLARGLEMNIALKTPTRILVRVDHYICRDFPKLFKNMSRFPWKKWVDPNCDIEVHASSKSSRLKIKSRIEETCLDAWQAQRNAPAAKDSPKLRLYVRVVDNFCTVSIDTSGERLHKRGTRVHVGEAPLRETIAASLIQTVGRSYDNGNFSVELVDPMMGSGTFLLEAATRDSLIEAREFAFEVFAEQPNGSPALQAARPKVEKLIGFEVDKKTMTAAKTNLASITGPAKVELLARDFFEAEPLPAPQADQRWLIANPPYGERLEVEGKLRDFYERLFAAAERVAKPDRACFLLPAKAVHGKFVLPYQWKVLEKRRFLNGGIPVVAFVFGRTAKNTLKSGNPQPA